MQILIEIPESEIPKQQDIIEIPLHFIDGKVCEAGNYGFEVLPKGHGDLISRKSAININERIKVKLTDYGKEIFYHQYDDLNKTYGREIIKPRYPKVDSDGYTSFQLWCFMNLYGRYIDMGMQNVIEPLEIVFESVNIEEKTAKWINETEETIECGNCHHIFDDFGLLNGDQEKFYEYPEFCPNCGRRMKGVSWKN